MEMSSGAPASTDLSAYTALLRRRWWIILTTAVIGVVLAAGYAFLQPRVYTSTASVLVTPTGVEEPTQITGGRTRTKINLDTQAQVAQSVEVARRAQQLMKSSTPPEELLEHVSVKIPPNSAILAISYDTTSPEAAKMGAHAFSRAYLENRYNAAQGEIQQQVKKLQKQLTAAQKKLEQLTGRLAALPSDSPDYVVTETKQSQVAREISDLQSDITGLSTTSITPGRIISSARLPTEPTSPVVPLYLASGLMVGLLLGVLAALLRDRADRRVRRAEDVERLLRLPVLLDVATQRQQASRGLVPARSPAGQAFHELYHSLTSTLGHGNHVVLVAGSSAGGGSSFTAANLAAVLARTETNVALVCADLQSTAITRLLGLAEGPGLSDILLYGAKVSEVEQRPPGLPRLRVIAPGLDGELAWERLQTHSMDSLVAELRRTATYVLVEAPPTSTSADALALAEASDAALVVVDVPRADRAQVREGIRQIDRVGTIVIGAVVVPSDSADSAGAAPTRRPAVAAQQPAQPAERPGSQPSHPAHTAPMPAIVQRSSTRSDHPAGQEPDGGQEHGTTGTGRHHGGGGAADPPGGLTGGNHGYVREAGEPPYGEPSSGTPHPYGDYGNYGDGSRHGPAPGSGYGASS